MPAPRPLPDSPDLDQLRRQAKDLLRAARAADPAALARFRALPSLAQASDDEVARTSLALHDAQSVIAREHGFPSWNALRDRVEEMTLGFDEAVRELVEAATDGRTSRAERLLALYPRIASASLHPALVLGDATAVEAQLARRPALATEPGGPRDWEPLHYVCHTSLVERSAARADGLVAIARRLLELGADPNTRFPWRTTGSDGRCCGVAMVELLVAKGADASRRRADGRTPFAVAELNGNRAVADWLREYGAADDLLPVD